MNTQRSPEFTHIVVGAGSAGCIAAARIVENSHFNVLLIEAGPDCQEDADGSCKWKHVRDIRRVPMKGQSEVFNDQIDWNVRVEVPNSDIPLHVAQARIVGGGSSINGGTALRNSVQDCKEWVELGNYAWDFESVKRIYEELEGNESTTPKGRHPLFRTPRGDAGLIQSGFLAGAAQHGLSWVDDLNSTGAEGSGASPVCRRGNERISAANTFIDPIRSRTNFHLLANTLVNRILFDQNLRAYGVLLEDGRELLAKAEIIVSAGAVFSPALLQRSGVGPYAHLQSLLIPLVQDLPVGFNLSDHPCIPVVARPKSQAYREGDYSLQMQARWSSALQPNAIDLQMICFSYLFVPPSDVDVNQQEGKQRSLGGRASGHVAGIGCNVNKPTSLGTVHITSRVAIDQPLVSPNYLSTATDRACARENVRLAWQIFISKPMQEVLSRPLSLTSEIIASDSKLDQWIAGQYSSTYHFCSSCRMARKEQGGVVDQSGRVYGVKGLRVCDASVIPTVPACNTMWTTMMFAERIGRSIRDSQDVGKDPRARI